MSLISPRMKRSSAPARSDVSLRSVSRSGKSREGMFASNLDIALPPLDELVVNVKSLKLTEQDNRLYNVKVTFFDQLIISKSIRPIWSRQKEMVYEDWDVSARGTMQYDPSDYEKMSLFADNPLAVQVILVATGTRETQVRPRSTRGVLLKTPDEAYCCNIDILPVFIEQDTICVRRRMQPNILPPLLKRKSWNNLPLLTVEISIVRNEANVIYQQMMKESNFMKFTLVGAYNMIVPYDYNYLYTAATKMPVSSEANTTLVTFSQGQPLEEDHSNLRGFYPKWETLRINEAVFSDCYEKFECSLDELNNPDLPQYLSATDLATLWGSFHRTLMFSHTEVWLKKHLRRYKWPLELHLYGDHCGYSFMGFVDLIRLIYPGERLFSRLYPEQRVLLEVPLVWVKSRMQEMMQECGCELLLTPIDKLPSTPTSPAKGSNTTRSPAESPTVASTRTNNSPKPLGLSLTSRGSGNEGGVAFVIVEVMLRKPLVKAAIPPHVSQHELYEMLMELEKSPYYGKKRECVGRGQLQRDWEVTMRLAVQALRKVPYYGITDFAAFNRQLSETRTRVELMTSIQRDAALYINNNFIVGDYLEDSDVTAYYEMLRVAHVSLVRETVKTLVVPPQTPTVHHLLRAARHARQMQDPLHAIDLYIQYTLDHKKDGNVWREIGTCLKDIDKEWAIICLYKAVQIDPLHPLTLIAMGCMLFEEDPEAAEPFFEAILMLFPLWATGWLIVSIYYYLREHYHMADKIYEQLQKTISLGIVQDYTTPRTWENELGDWWDPTPLTVTGLSRYFDAADLLLRLRALNWAEVCAARILSLYGESPLYYHIIALCYRLRGDYSEALCLLKSAHCDFRAPYLLSLEAECHHKLGNIDDAQASFEKTSGANLCPYSVLLGLPHHDKQKSRSVLVELTRRQPTAYAWMALAEDWLSVRMKDGDPSVVATTADAGDDVPPQVCAIACAIQALRIDRRAARAWALLADYTWPEERRVHCRDMAATCGYSEPKGETNESHHSNSSMAYQLGWTLTECKCCMCYHFQIS